jgi:hypothetical protein
MKKSRALAGKKIKKERTRDLEPYLMLETS